MINTINLNNLRNAEHLQFGTDAIQLISTANAATLGIDKPFTNFKSGIAAIENAFKQEQSSALSQQLADLDTQRDTLFTAIWDIIDGYLNHFNENTVAQAQLLKHNLSIYGKATVRLSYPAETANINSLIADWEGKTDLAAALTALHLDEWKKELKTINAQFAAVYNQRVSEEGNAATDNIGNLKVLRAASIKQWNVFTTTLIAQYYLHEDDSAALAPYASLINNINALIVTYSNIIAVRQGKNKKGTTPVTPPVAGTNG